MAEPHVADQEVAVGRGRAASKTGEARADPSCWALEHEDTYIIHLIYNLCYV